MKAAAQASASTRRLVLARCPLCDADSASAQVIAQHETVWVRCACGLLYKRSDDGSGETDGSLGHHYDETYFEKYARRRRRRVQKARLQILDALEHAPPGPLLDVGCSLGYSLQAARELDREAAGVDLSEAAVAHCRRRGFEARRGMLESLPFPDGSFAVVLLKHVFEHTPRPRAALGELRRVLSDRGVLFLAVPDATYRKVDRPGTSRFFRGEAGRAHFVCYSPATLAQLLAEEGFRVVQVHPAAVHRKASLLRRTLERMALPARLPAARLRTAARLRKEFWMIAVRDVDHPKA